MLDNQIFFQKINPAILNNYKQLAVEYLTFLLEQYFDNSNNAKDENGYLTILSSDNNLESITKHALLIADSLYIVDRKSNKSQHILRDTSTSDLGYITDYYVYNQDLNKLGKWIKESRTLLSNGIVSYIPSGYTRTYDCDNEGKRGYSGFLLNTRSLSYTRSKSIYTNKLIDLSGNIDNAFLEPVLSLQIPVLKDINMEDFSNITLDNIDELKNFQTYLKHSLLSIRLDSNEIQRLSMDLQMQLNDIQKSYNNTIHKYKLNLAIGSIAMVTAILFSLNPKIDEIFKIASGVGSGFGLLDFLRSNQEYFSLKNELKLNNCYFLWALQNK